MTTTTKRATTKKPKRVSSGVALRIKRKTGRFSEKQVPARAREALVAASRRAKAARLPVMEIEGGKLVRVASDGERTVVKTLEPGIKVKAGQKITLR